MKQFCLLLYFFFIILQNTRNASVINIVSHFPNRPQTDCHKDRHQSESKATLEAPYRCFFFHKPSRSRSAGLQTGSERSASGTAQGSPRGYEGSVGIVLQCPHCRTPGCWKNKSSTSRHDK